MIVRDHSFLELAAGVRSAIARLDRLLDRHAPEHDAPDPGALTDGAAIVLGVIAIRARLLAAFDALPADPGHGDRAPAHDLTGESWLR